MNQLFFIIDNRLDHTYIERNLRDLNIKNPQLINNGSYHLLINYLDVYPVNQYISDAIKVFNNIIHDINQILDKEIEESKIKSKDVYEIIHNLEYNMSLLKESLNHYNNHVFDYYNDLQNVIELEVYMSPANYLLIRKIITYIIHKFNFIIYSRINSRKIIKISTL